MSKVKVVDNAVVIVSALQVSDIDMLKKFKPEALKLIDPETKDEKFAIGFGKNGSISKYGIAFDSKDNSGRALISFNIPADVEPAKRASYVKDTFGYGLLTLNKLESQALEALGHMAEDFSVMDESIEVVE